MQCTYKNIVLKCIFASPQTTGLFIKDVHPGSPLAGSIMKEDQLTRVLIIYLETLLDCDWLISMPLNPKQAIFCIIKV
jgi:hypothetical protein